MYPSIIHYTSKTYADGSHPVIVQVVVNRKPLRKVLFRLESKHYDSKVNRVKPTHVLYLKYNELISQTLSKIELRCIDAMSKGRKITKEYLFAESTDETTLADAISQYLDKLRSENKHTSAEKCSNLIGKVSEFSPSLLLQDVDVDWMDRFFNYLRKFNSHNTASKNINTIITVLRYMRKKGLYNNNEAIENRKQSKPTTKDKLSREEINMIEQLPLEGVIDVVRDSFLLSFYLRGSRISDILTLQRSEIHGDRIIKEARKTGKASNMAIVPQARAIIEKYAQISPVYVLPLIKMLPPDDPNDKRYRKTIGDKTAVVNKYLKIIAGMIGSEKNLTSHVARHTFAYLADQFGMSATRIKDFLNHHDLQTTMNYINDLNKDDILDKEMDNFARSFTEKPTPK